MRGICDYCGHSESDSDRRYSECDSDGSLFERENYEPIMTTEKEQKDNIFNMQQSRINAFKAQDAEKGNFDITFDLSGKILRAHKFIFATVSPLLDAMISERWTSKDEAIKIETYTYEEFYQCLLFLYAGTCDITEDNISRLVDMAEFYGVAVMKEHCDTFLSKMIRKIAVEPVEELMEMAQRYSLSESVDALKRFIRRNMKDVLQPDLFLKFKPSFLKSLTSVKKTTNGEQNFFLSLVKWAERRVSANNAQPLGETETLLAVKAELEEILPTINFSKMEFKFVKQFVVDKAFLFSAKKLYEIIAHSQRGDTDEWKLFETLYRVAEKNVEKQNVSDEVIDIPFSIKAELAEVLPKIKFRVMDKQNLIDFAAKTGFITRQQAIECFFIRVEIESGGKRLTGSFEDVLKIQNSHRSYYGSDSTRGNAGWKLNAKSRSENKHRFTDLKFNIPKSPSLVQQMRGVDWYLLLEKDGVLAVKHRTMVVRSDYLISELRADEQFVFDKKYASLTVSFYSI